ncbi:MAG: PD-(D/E)XK nuclease family protein [Lachnospiraceae bacterium]|nr:PD-(D/E)XK nuclease family protein [Lachnospiraceae bacterium]
MQSIFSYLKSYVPSEGRDPKEDYLTQMFAWILTNIDEAARVYIGFLYEKVGEAGKDIEGLRISVSTQEVLKVSDGVGRIDLLIKVGEDDGFICEHKVFSDLSENQIQKYMDNADQLGNRTYYSVLVTYSSSQWIQDSDVAITWSDIYSLFEEKIVKSGLLNSNEVGAFIIREFMAYLHENDMGGYTNIRPDMMRSWFVAPSLEKSLERLFKELVNENWEDACPNLSKSEFGGYKPSYNGRRWGRLGIDFHANWMGVFAGVLLDPRDHGLYPTDESKGPDFCIFIDSDYAKNGEKQKIYENNVSLPFIVERKKSLRDNCGDYDYFPGLDSSPWRIIALRKPLLDVMRGAYDRKAQYEKLRQEIISGINLMIGKE